MLPDHSWDWHTNAVQNYYMEKHHKSHIVINHINPNIINVLQYFSHPKQALKYSSHIYWCIITFLSSFLYVMNIWTTSELFKRSRYDVHGCHYSILTINTSSSWLNHKIWIGQGEELRCSFFSSCTDLPLFKLTWLTQGEEKKDKGNY